MTEFIFGNHPAQERFHPKDVMEGCELIFQIASGLNLNLEAISIGGSYAHQKDSEEQLEIDVDFLFNKFELTKDLINLKDLCVQASLNFVREKKLILHINMLIDRSGQMFRFFPFDLILLNLGVDQNAITLYSKKHPNSPYVALNQKAVSAWKLES